MLNWLIIKLFIGRKKLMNAWGRSLKEKNIFFNKKNLYIKNKHYCFVINNDRDDKRQGFIFKYDML